MPMTNRLVICGSPRARGRSAGLSEAVRLAYERAFPADRVETAVAVVRRAHRPLHGLRSVRLQHRPRRAVLRHRRRHGARAAAAERVRRARARVARVLRRRAGPAQVVPRPFRNPTSTPIGARSRSARRICTWWARAATRTASARWWAKYARRLRWRAFRLADVHDWVGRVSMAGRFPQESTRCPAGAPTPPRRTRAQVPTACILAAAHRRGRRDGATFSVGQPFGHARRP